MTATALLDVELLPLTRALLAGQAEPLTFLLRCPESSPEGVRLKSIDCRDPHLTVDTDLLPRDAMILPGESCRATLRVRAAVPLTVSLQEFFVEYVDKDNQSDYFNCPAGTLTFRHSLVDKVADFIDPLCTYKEGTKVQITLKYTGADVLKDLRIHLEPEASIVTAKTIRHGIFRPNEEIQMEAVLRPGPVEIVVSAAAFGGRTETRLSRTIESVPGREKCPSFRFLEPRRLARDRITIRRGQEPESPPVGLHSGAYPVYGQEKYQLIIQPGTLGVTDISLRGIPERIVVLSKKHEPSPSLWTFLLEVTASQLFSQPQRVYYDVKSKSGPFTGEVHLILKPPRLRYFRFAATLGAALTIQGAVGLFRILGDDSDLSGKLLGETLASWEFQRSLWSFFSIPIACAIMPLVDALQYRLTAEP